MIGKRDKMSGYICKVCGYKSKTEEAMKNHVKEKHRDLMAKSKRDVSIFTNRMKIIEFAKGIVYILTWLLSLWIVSVVVGLGLIFLIYMLGSLLWITSQVNKKKEKNIQKKK